MNNIIPAIIAENFDDLKEKISKVEGLVEWAQIDVMDGKFAPSVSWNSPLELQNIDTNLKIEIHLMVQNPEENIRDWISSGARRVIVHYESTSQEEVEKVISNLKFAGMEAGVALRIETDVSKIENLISSLDVVQFMGIDKIGYYGQEFDSRVIEKIKNLRKNFSNVKIGIDGGVNLENAKALLEAGADNLIVGSMIFRSSNIADTIKKLQDLQV